MTTLSEKMSEIQKAADELGALAGLPPIRSIPVEDLDEGYSVKIEKILIP